MVKKSKKFNVELSECLDKMMDIEFAAFSKKICLFKKLEKLLKRNTVNFKLRNLGINIDFSKEELEELQKFLSRNTTETKLKIKGINYRPHKFEHGSTAVSKEDLEKFQKFLNKNTVVPKGIKNKPLKILGNKKQQQIFEEIENRKNKIKEEMFNLLDKDVDKYIENREL